MATEHAMATMERAANDRIDAAMRVLGERFAVTVPEQVAERLDARMSGIRTLERHATVLELLAAATDPDAPASEAESLNLDAMKRADLNAYAKERGIEKPESFKNKTELIAAIEAAAESASQEEKTSSDETNDESASGEAEEGSES